MAHDDDEESEVDTYADLLLALSVEREHSSYDDNEEKLTEKVAVPSCSALKSGHTVTTPPPPHRPPQVPPICPPSPAYPPQSITSPMEDEERNNTKRPRSASPTSDNDSSEGKPKRMRTSAHQRTLLESHFLLDQMPSQQTRVRLARDLDMSPRRIQVWFQNKRAKLKRQKKQDPFTKNPVTFNAATRQTFVPPSSSSNQPQQQQQQQQQRQQHFISSLSSSNYSQQQQQQQRQQSFNPPSPSSASSASQQRQAHCIQPSFTHQFFFQSPVNMANLVK